MKKRLWEHRIPTIPAFIVILVSIWVTLFLIKNNTFITTKASPDTEPAHVTTGNITSNSATVVFSTNSPTSAGIKLSSATTPERIVFDDRDTAQAGQVSFRGHIFTLTDLQPNTQYTYTLLVEGKTYTDSYTFTTAPVLSDGPSIHTIHGSIVLPNGTPASDAIILVKFLAGQTITTITNDQGEFTVPVTHILSESLSEYLNISDTTSISIEAFRDGMSSSTTTIYQNSQSIPTITLSENYAFDTTSSDDETASVSSQFSLPDSIGQTSQTIAITSPRADQALIDSQPLFRGTALPSQKVRILISASGRLEAEVISNAAGNWSYRPTTALGAGQHTLTIQSPDKFNIVRSVSRSFSVLASGSQVTESATPSATPIVTVTPTTIPTATPTPTVIVGSPTPTTTTPTATTTPIPTFTPTPTLTPTATFTPTPILSITPTPPGSISTIVITFLSVLCIIIGTTLLFVVS